MTLLIKMFGLQMILNINPEWGDSSKHGLFQKDTSDFKFLFCKPEVHLAFGIPKIKYRITKAVMKQSSSSYKIDSLLHSICNLLFTQFKLQNIFIF